MYTLRHILNASIFKDCGVTKDFYNKIFKVNLLTSGVNRCYNEEEIPKKQKKIDPAKDRTKVIPVETSIRYMESEAYRSTYRDQSVWVMYRRNFKGHYPPRKTRKSCIKGGVISTGNPCPICRDEYLIVDYRNLKLIEQFICPHTGSVLSYQKTNVCQLKHREIMVAVEKARDFGLVTFDVPFRFYNYADYCHVK